MNAFPGCSPEPAKCMYRHLLRARTARQLDPLITYDQQRIFMMEYRAGLCSRVYEDGENGFDRAVTDCAAGHNQSWDGKTGRACDAEITQQSSFNNPSDTGGY
ncbi:unnamed protein product [Caenorhabditis brenneri]